MCLSFVRIEENFDFMPVWTVVLKSCNMLCYFGPEGQTLCYHDKCPQLLGRGSTNTEERLQESGTERKTNGQTDLEETPQLELSHHSKLQNHRKLS